MMTVLSPLATQFPATLPDWLAWLEQDNRQSIALGLDSIKQVGRALGLLPITVPVITIAGTNGKGSCAQLLARAYHNQGYQVGCYTSPHLVRFNERISVAGEPACDQWLVDAFSLIESRRRSVVLTFFEYTTLAALLIFQRADVDVMVLEVGLGGRLDAVNVVDPDVAIITSLARDHTEWLGDTLAAIGREKAGIFRPSADLICSVPEPPLTVVEQAAHCGRPLWRRQHHYHCRETGSGGWQWCCAGMSWSDWPCPILPQPIAATALMALHALSSVCPVGRAALSRALATTCLPGRFEVIAMHFELILEVAHNPEACRWFAERLAQQPRKRTTALVAMLSDKDVEASLTPLIEQVDHWWVTAVDHQRAAPNVQLSTTLRKLGVRHITNCQSVAAAWRQLENEIPAGERVIIFGSFYLIGAVKGLLG